MLGPLLVCPWSTYSAMQPLRISTSTATVGARAWLLRCTTAGRRSTGTSHRSVGAQRAFLNKSRVTSPLRGRLKHTRQHRHATHTCQTHLHTHTHTHTHARKTHTRTCTHNTDADADMYPFAPKMYTHMHIPMYTCTHRMAAKIATITVGPRNCGRTDRKTAVYTSFVVAGVAKMKRSPFP